MKISLLITLCFISTSNVFAAHPITCQTSMLKEALKHQNDVFKISMLDTISFVKNGVAFHGMDLFQKKSCRTTIFFKSLSKTPPIGGCPEYIFSLSNFKCDHK